MSFRGAWLSALVAACSGIAGCSGSDDAAAKQSAAQVARGVEVLRNAANPAKAAALAPLVHADCSGPDVCETRDACATAYAQHVEGLALTEAAKLQLTTGKSLEASKLLGTAERKLGEAASKIADCTDREASLRRRYKL